MELTCPKCQGAMRSYERNGVTVDQCTECRGLFLDRGELDRLIDAENSWHGEPARPSATSAPAGGERSGASPGTGKEGLGAMVGEVLRQTQGHRSSGHDTHSSHGYPKKRKKSFLDEMFG